MLGRLMELYSKESLREGENPLSFTEALRRVSDLPHLLRHNVVDNRQEQELLVRRFFCNPRSSFCSETEIVNRVAGLG